MPDEANLLSLHTAIFQDGVGFSLMLWCSIVRMVLCCWQSHWLSMCGMRPCRIWSKLRCVLRGSLVGHSRVSIHVQVLGHTH